MCGRTVCHLAPDQLCRASGRWSKGGKWSQPKWRNPPCGRKYYPSYNQAPTSYTPILMSKKHLTQEEIESCADLNTCEEQENDETPLDTEDSNYVIQPMHWGLVPSWHQGDPKSTGYNMINARSDGMLSKRTFKGPLEKGRRCIALIDGYYEWQTKGDNKQPYYIYNKSNVKQECHAEVKVKSEVKTESKLEVKTEVKTEVKAEIKTEVKTEVKQEGETKVTEVVETENKDNNKPLLMVAGLFDIWRNKEGEPLYSFSMITVDAHKDMAWLHHRMPALLQSAEDVTAWLDFGEVPLTKAIEVIHPVTDLGHHPVTKAVGKVANNTADLITPIDPKNPKPKPTKSSNFMAAWLTKGSAKMTKNDQKCQVPPNDSVKEEPDQSPPAKKTKLN